MFGLRFVVRIRGSFGGYAYGAVVEGRMTHARFEFRVQRWLVSVECGTEPWERLQAGPADKEGSHKQVAVPGEVCAVGRKWRW